MFLSQLTDKEKVMYYALAKKAADVNGVTNEDEINCLDDYCKEMDLDPDEIQNLPHIGSEEIFDSFSNAQYSHKKIVLFEAIVFMTVDGVYDEQEKVFINEFAQKIGLNPDEVDRISGLVEKYISCVSDIANAILL